MVSAGHRENIAEVTKLFMFERSSSELLGVGSWFAFVFE